MKTGIFFALLSASLFFLFSCEKDDTDSKNSTVRIETETDFYNGALSNYITFRYDEYDRIIERSYIVDYAVGITTEKTIYNDDIIITYQYYAESDTPEISFDYLNTKGFVDSTVSSINGNVHAKITYAYDNEGYLTNREYKSDVYQMYFTDNYEYENGNRKKAVFKTVFGSLGAIAFNPSILTSRLVADPKEVSFLQKRLDVSKLKSAASQTVYIDTVFYEYNDKVNTISYVNKGHAWEGLPSKNLISKEIDHSNGETHTYIYSYEYDDKGRVTKEYPDDNSFWSTFTYVE
jgi:hypothetical protein